MNYRGEITHLLFLAHAEKVRAKAQSFLHAAAKLAEEWVQKEPSSASRIMQAEVHAELAGEHENPANRAAEWRKALAILKLPSSRGADETTQQASAFATIAVDCFQDRYTSQPDAERIQYLRKAEDLLTEAIAQSTEDSKPALLARKSSVLRKLAATELRREVRLGRIRECKRCIDLARASLRDSGTAIEAALVEWELAQYAETDEVFANQLREAETIFESSLVSRTEIGRLAYAEFLRGTYRPLDACTQFMKCLDEVVNLRRLLGSAHQYAESAISLWFQDTPSELLNRHLQESRSLVEIAIGAGFHNARVVLDLAYISAILDGPPKGHLILREVCPSRAEINWDKAAQLAGNANPNDLITEGFVLGMTDSSTWARLGTFFKRFCDDVTSAEVFYRTAIRLNPQNSIALTNLARLLVESDRPEYLDEAERLVQRAQSFSDRRFTWWRQVLAQIEAARGHYPVEKVARKPNIGQSLHNIRQVRQRFRETCAYDDARERGYALEALVYELAKLTFGTASPPYTIRRDGVGAIEQVDGFFKAGADKYRVECKWTKEKTSGGQIGEFFASLDIAGVSGLFISINGFSSAAIEKARGHSGQRAILLMDGEEARFLFEGQIRFDELMSRKRLHLDQRSDPFHRVVPAYIPA